MIVATDILLSIILVLSTLLMVIINLSHRSILKKLCQINDNLIGRIDEYDNNVAGVEEKLFDYKRDIAHVRQQLKQVLFELSVSNAVPSIRRYPGSTPDRVVFGFEKEAVTSIYPGSATDITLNSSSDSAFGYLFGKD
jgi:hypothetical protein